MFAARQLTHDVWWVGAIDWNARSFHGYSTPQGTTYNAYLILDEKVTLIDTVRAPFADELMDRIAQIVDPAKIDYIISNHVETDHSGALPNIIRRAPQATIISSAPQGVAGLKAHFGDNFTFQPVKTGDTLTIGKRTLEFVQTPMVHWPDNMVTYSAYDKILFSNDAFGQHYASSTRFDFENDFSNLMACARKYYANIVQPYGAQASRALAAVKDLDIDMIAPSHGIIWKDNIADIMALYDTMVAGTLQTKAVVAYSTMSHSTEKMAHAISEAFTQQNIPVTLFDLSCSDHSDIITEVMDAQYVCLGTATLNKQMMPDMGRFVTYLKGLLAPKNERIGLAFGSCGWAAAGADNLQKEMEAMKFTMATDKALAQQWVPTDDDLYDIQRKIYALVMSGGKAE